jgi:prepilin-type N-terminal cleavage/methylation domain-containing protein
VCPRRQAFTLIELMVVIGIIAILLAFVGPAVVSLSRTSGTKGAVSTLMNAIEQARALAITSGSATYVVFADQSTPERYRCRAFIIFQDNATFVPAAVSKWYVLPEGISLRPAAGVLAQTPAVEFACPQPVGSALLPYIKFEPTGMVVAPTDPNTLFVCLFSGFVDGGGQQTFTDKVQQTTQRYDAIVLARFTGRSRYVYPFTS